MSAAARPFSRHGSAVVRVVVLFVCLLLASNAARGRTITPIQADTSGPEQRAARGLLIRGITQSYLEDYDEAISYFEKALEQTPNEPAILAALADAEADRENLTSALYYARQARTYGSNNPSYYRTLADLLRRSERPEAAVRAYQELLSVFPGQTDARFELARLQADLDRPRAALDNFEAVVDSAESKRAAAYTEMLPLYRQLENEDALERTLTALIDLRRDASIYRRRLGSLYVEQERYRDAIPVFEALLEESPRDPQTLTQLRMLYSETGQPEKAKRLWESVPPQRASPDQLVARARALYRTAPSDTSQRPPRTARRVRSILKTALEKDSTHLGALDLLGTLEFQHGAYARAADLLDRALQKNPRNQERWQRGADAYLRSGAPQRAAELADEGLLLFPGTPALLRIAAIAHLRLGAYDTARAHFEEALTRLDTASASLEARARLHAGLGQAHMRLGDLDAADRAFETALSLAPTQRDALVHFAQSLARRDRALDRALRLVERAVAEHPNDPDALRVLGWVHFRRTEYEAAKSAFQQAIRTGASSATVYEQFGDVHRALGNHSEARQYWRKALKQAPERELLRRKIRKSPEG